MYVHSLEDVLDGSCSVLIEFSVQSYGKIQIGRSLKKFLATSDKICLREKVQGKEGRASDCNRGIIQDRVAQSP